MHQPYHKRFKIIFYHEATLSAPYNAIPLQADLIVFCACGGQTGCIIDFCTDDRVRLARVCVIEKVPLCQPLTNHLRDLRVCQYAYLERAFEV